MPATLKKKGCLVGSILLGNSGITLAVALQPKMYDSCNRHTNYLKLVELLSFYACHCHE
jgi:hypothetical protein